MKKSEKIFSELRTNRLIALLDPKDIREVEPFVSGKITGRVQR